MVKTETLLSQVSSDMDPINGVSFQGNISIQIQTYLTVYFRVVMLHYRSLKKTNNFKKVHLLLS